MEYRYYYILSFFNGSRSTSVSQLTHIFHGKRTPSMFYLAEINKWHHAFSQYKTVSREDIEKATQYLFARSLIKKVDKGFSVTDEGRAITQTYFKNHYFPHFITSFLNMNIRESFWDRYQLFVQAFSEMSFQNAKYAPIIKHPHHQENVRQLFHQFRNEKKSLLENWIKEQHFLFSQLEESRVNVLISQLTGHHRIGDTKTQVQGKLSMEPLEYALYHQDSIEIILTVIKKNKLRLPIMYALLEQLHQETNHGLSMSTYESFQLINQNYSISDISRMRFLKENTVREHVLEMAFVLEEFPIDRFVPKEIYNYLKKCFDEDKDCTYSEVVMMNSEIEFMHYRLVELERIRHHE